MPSTTAMDTTKALVIRPILLNVMRFLNTRRRPHCDAPSAASNSMGIRILPLIVEAAATLRHFQEETVVTSGCQLQVAGCQLGFNPQSRRHIPASECSSPTTCNFFHHTRHALTGIIGWPTLQPNALPNSGKFSTAPLIRQ